MNTSLAIRVIRMMPENTSVMRKGMFRLIFSTSPPARMTPISSAVTIHRAGLPRASHATIMAVKP